MKSNYCIFDIVKFILSLLVVQIHIGLFSSYSSEVEEIFKNLIGRYAVPLFFLISSYLLFDKINKKNLFSQENIKIYKKYFKRLLIIYTSWTLIYFIFLKYFFNINISFVYFIVNYIFTGFYRQFWFLNAQIIGTSIFLILLKRNSIKRILVFSTIFYIIGLILVPYNSLFSNVNLIPKYNGNVLICRNFLTFALIYISVGYYLNLIKDKISNIKLKKYSILIFSILSFLEFLYLKKINCQYYALQIFILLNSVNIFIVLINTKVKFDKKFVYLRKISVYIYCLHTLVYLVLNKYITCTNSVIMYLITILICITIAIAFEYANKKIIKRCT